ncbi:hypothetical protein GCM10025790_21370 [Nesterenkonia rhizosphaerae]|uniref:AbiEi antitoxin N-terminal domain-containing protein n=1 Tax=Nesterenkonia rhizosphaerae TaxID=1348272 RepID=A0ABP9FZZ3_9MICC
MVKLGELAEDRWGVFTTDQAEEVGVKRKHLARMATSGALERLDHGVYRLIGAPHHPHEEVLTAWMAVGGWKGGAGDVPAAVVGGEAAANLHDVGDFYLDEIDLLVPRRRLTRRENIRLRTRVLDSADVTFVDSIATLTPERCITDLLDISTDLSLVEGVVERFRSKGAPLQSERLASLLEPLARRYGFTPQDGWTFAAHLMRTHERV